MDALSNTSLVTVLSLSDSPSDTSAVLTREEDEIDPGVQKINGDAQSGRPPLLCWNSGVGLGPISIEFFAREKWPLRNQEDSIQYGKFANLIFKRIEAGESNNTETACFCEMFGTVEHWLYMIPLLEFLPESKENG